MKSSLRFYTISPIKLGGTSLKLAPSSRFAYRVFTLHLTSGSPLYELRRPGPETQGVRSSCGVYELMKASYAYFGIKKVQQQELMG